MSLGVTPLATLQKVVIDWQHLNKDGAEEQSIVYFEPQVSRVFVITVSESLTDPEPVRLDELHQRTNNDRHAVLEREDAYGYVNLSLGLKPL